jgi:hypothetical protein
MSGLAKQAQSKWRSLIDQAKDTKELVGLFAEFNRNRMMSGADWVRSLPFRESTDLNESKLKMKQFLSDFDSKENSLTSRRELERDALSAMDIDTGHNPEEWMPIIHGTNDAKGRSFLQGGNGASKTDVTMRTEDGKATDMGIMVHNKKQDLATFYARRNVELRGGTPVIIEGKIQRKYLFPNPSRHSGGGDEYAIPTQHYDKIQDATTRLAFPPATTQIPQEVPTSGIPFGTIGLAVGGLGLGGLLAHHLMKKKEDSLDKTATLNPDVKLHEHQEHFVNKPGNAVIAAHPVGSGKTLSGIARFEHLRDTGAAHHALVVVPSSLRNNFGQDGVAKFTNSSFNIIGNQQERQQGLAHATNPESDYNIVSYDLFRKAPQQYLDDAKADTLILDEFHRGKNEGTLTTDSLKSAKGHYQNLIGLTGSPVSNSVSDIQPLMEIAGNTNLGASKKEFADRYFKRDDSKKYQNVHQDRRPIIGFNHRKQLQRELGSVVDYVDESEIQELAKMPHKKIDIVRVPISRQQAHFYRGLLDKNPDVRKLITAKRSETMKDEEISKSFNQLIEARKLMNSVGSVQPGISLSDSAKLTPKTKLLLDDLESHLQHTPDGQALLFSHLINGGVDVMEQGLKDRHIPYGEFIGKGNKNITEASRQQDVMDFNAGKKRVMIVSPAGGEGLSLNNTTWEGVLDPHYNPEKMNQMEARGVRSGGLAHRPEAERNVHINRYLATMPKRFGIFKSNLKTPDEFIYESAQRKDQQNGMLRQLMQEEQQRQRKEAARQQIAKL